MITLRGISMRAGTLSFALGLGFGGASPVAAAGAASAADDAPATDTAATSSVDVPVPQENVFASITQSFKQDYDKQVVRGYFDVGAPPDAHRYYCLVDPKTGKKQPNGVPGQPVSRPDGMTGIKASSVSVYSCASAEQEGILMTSGYVLTGKAAAASQPTAATGAAANGATATGAPVAAAGGKASGANGAAGVAAPNGATGQQVAAAGGMASVTNPGAGLPADTVAAKPALPDRYSVPGRVDIAGVKLGMSVDEVRAVLTAKQLLHYGEVREALGHLETPAGGSSAAGGRFVNVIAAWTATRPATGENLGEEGESFQVMFTPVPGKERVMAIVHTVADTPTTAVREATLDQALVAKYGGAVAADALPVSPTWTIQSNGRVLSGDTCKRRDIFGGLKEVNVADAVRQNLALRTTPDEFRFQIEHCGVAIVTADHATADQATAGGATRASRLVTRYTVTAYSPSLAFDGATSAAQLIQSRGDAGKDGVAPAHLESVPNL